MRLWRSRKVSQGSDIVPDTLILSLKDGGSGSEVTRRSCRRDGAQRPHCFLLASRRLECWAGLWVTFTAPHTLSDNYIAEAGGNIAGGLSNANGTASNRPAAVLPTHMLRKWHFVCLNDSVSVSHVVMLFNYKEHYKKKHLTSPYILMCHIKQKSIQFSQILFETFIIESHGSTF